MLQVFHELFRKNIFIRKLIWIKAVFNKNAKASILQLSKKQMIPFSPLPYK